jgi:hypothetical protein
MAGLPVNVSQGTVTGQILLAQHAGGDADVDGVAAVGTVTFTPSVTQLLHAGSNLVIVPKPITVTLDGTGAFTTKLIATDDTDLSVTGWTYRATFAVEGLTTAITPFSFAVPSGSTQDIADLLGGA